VTAERCESYHAIDLARLKRWKMLQPGRSSSIEWSSGSVGIVASNDRVHLVYRHRAAGEPWQQARCRALHLHADPLWRPSALVRMS
jgi:hypothetical protein